MANASLNDLKKKCVQSLVKIFIKVKLSTEFSWKPAGCASWPGRRDIFPLPWRLL